MKSNEIEYINALAPFDHGVWEGKSTDGEKITVGDQALFRSRSEWLVDKIITYLTKEFSTKSLSKMSVLEVGSYDGWVLTQICKRIKFLEVTGVEPRLKNIKKGEVGRRLANVETQARFVQGSADDILELFPDRNFDIVICLGMLHHVSSTFDTISSLCTKSDNVCIIDSMIIPELKDDVSNIEPFVNTRDIIYHGEENLWTVAAFKYESPYGDGSRPNFGIVNVPSARLIEMSLRSCGFSTMNSLGDESDFFDSSGQKLRGVKEVLAVSKREIAADEIDDRWIEKVKNSENIFCHISLPNEIILSLSKIFSDTNNLNLYSDVCDLTQQKYDHKIEQAIKAVISVGLDEETRSVLEQNLQEFDNHHAQILSVIFRSPYEKIILEVAKFFLKKGKPDLAIKYLQLIVRKAGCDWWSFYRSCYMLRKSFQDKGNDEESKHYQELLLLSNENFPF